MTDKKLTDNEIIKAYEGLTSNQQLNLFKNYYYNDGFSTEKGIVANAINDILPKYYKQQAEIENLKNENFILSQKRANIFEITDAYGRGRSKAVKEFAEKLKHSFFDNGYESPDVDFDYFVDNIVKEMVGDDND